MRSGLSNLGRRRSCDRTCDDGCHASGRGEPILSWASEWNPAAAARARRTVRRPVRRRCGSARRGGATARAWSRRPTTSPPSGSGAPCLAAFGEQLILPGRVRRGVHRSGHRQAVGFLEGLDGLDRRRPVHAVDSALVVPSGGERLLQRRGVVVHRSLGLLLLQLAISWCGNLILSVCWR
jgi:hypothetical protein